MTLLDEVAVAVLEGRRVEARAAWHELVRTCRDAAELPMPETSSPTARALAARLAELLAARADQCPQAWSASVPGAPGQRFLVSARTAWKRDHLRKTAP